MKSLDIPVDRAMSNGAIGGNGIENNGQENGRLSVRNRDCFLAVKFVSVSVSDQLLFAEASRRSQHAGKNDKVYTQLFVFVLHSEARRLQLWAQTTNYHRALRPSDSNMLCIFSIPRSTF